MIMKPLGRNPLIPRNPARWLAMLALWAMLPAAAVGAPVAQGSWQGSAFVLRGPGGGEDADGEELPVRALAIDGDRVVLGVDDDLDRPASRFGAAYVLLREGGEWRVEAKLYSPDRHPGDYFGAAVAVAGDLIVIGAPSDDGACAPERTGQAHVFVRVAGAWTHRQTLTGADSLACDGFGRALAIDGQRMVIGSPGHATSGEPERGAAYVFEAHDADWIQTAKLVDAEGAHHGEFGRAVALSGSTVIVGSPAQFAERPGSVQLYGFDGTGWLQQSRLQAINPRTGDLFGLGLALGGDDLLVTGVGMAPEAFRKIGGHFVADAALPLPAAVLDGDLPRIAAAATQAFVLVAQQPVDAPSVGMYLLGFNRGSGGWQRVSTRRLADSLQFVATVATDGSRVAASTGPTTSAEVLVTAVGVLRAEGLTAVPVAPASDSFGRVIALSGDTLLAASGGAGLRGAEPAVDAFEHRASGWQHVMRLPFPDGLDRVDSLYGGAIAVDGEHALVGAAQNSTGRVFVYARHNGPWVLESELADESAAAFTEFGRTVALSGDTALVGDPSADAGLGRVYVYQYGGGQWQKQALLTSSLEGPSQQFGRALALDGDFVAVGGDTVEVFERSQGLWSAPIPLIASGGEPLAGHALALEGDTLLVALRDTTTMLMFRRSAPQVWTESGRFDVAGEPSRFAFSGSSALVAVPALDPADGVRAFQYELVESGGLMRRELHSPGGQVDRFPLALAVEGPISVIGSPTISGPFPYGNELEGEVRIYDQRIAFVSGFE